MRSRAVAADPAALEDLAVKIRVTVDDACRASEEAVRQAARVVARQRHAVARRREDVRSAKSELERHKLQPDEASDYRASVVLAERRLRDASGDLREAEEALERYRSERLKLVHRLQELRSSGVRMLARKTESLGRMNSVVGHIGAKSTSGMPGGRVTGGRRASSAGTPASGVIRSAPGLPEGFFLVPLGLIDMSGSGVRSESDFKKGYTPDDLAWALDALEEVILPGIARGMTREDFIALDEKSGRSGTRSYSDTYQGFLGTNSADPIRLEPTGDGRYSIINGQHRIWVASRDDRSSVPARVVS